jgi:hypothetical protein
MLCSCVVRGGDRHWCARHELLRVLFGSRAQLLGCATPYSTSRLMVVAITSVHPGCALHPVHPGCTSGYGDWWAGVLAGAGLARVVRPFSPGRVQESIRRR